MRTLPDKETVAVPTATTLTTDSYGNIQFSTNSLTDIQQSSSIQTVIKTVYQKKPQIAVLVPLAIKTITYGNLI